MCELGPVIHIGGLNFSEKKFLRQQSRILAMPKELLSEILPCVKVHLNKCSCQRDFTSKCFCEISISGPHMIYPDRSGVYLQCHAVCTAATLQPMQFTRSIGCSWQHFCTLQYTATCSVHAPYTAGTLKLYCLYTPLRSG